MTEVANVTIQDIISKMKKTSKRVDVKLIMKSYELAKEKHKNQYRKSGEAYIIHPLHVAYILAEIGLDTSTICAALLHDTVEDTDVTQEDIVKMFGSEISDLVAGVTKLGNIQFSSIEERQVEDYRKMFLAMGKDIRVIIIKLADRLHNMRTLKHLMPERQYAISKETIDLYAPLANRLGLYSIKWELEDLAFKYLQPKEYHELVEGINKKREERLKFIEKIILDIKIELRRQRIDAEVTGRAKHLYSIHKKMLRDNKTLDQIYDLFALRILVHNIKDCYSALGVVHEMYNPMPGRFKDYIAVPKPNMYQSIHTTLLGDKGTPFEVQIRTFDMHRIAEFGIAAHWAYKEANYGKNLKQVVKVEEDKFAWLRESLEWQQEMQDPDEFLNRLKTELFEDEVYVFTPKGEIKNLPKGSTPIDFAYSIHEQIGHRMTGCKINSKMMPIITDLKSGDIVEIITSDKPKGPSRDWLRFIKSTSARNKITNWFKKEKKEENIAKGKELVEKELKRIGMEYETLFKNEYIDKLFQKYKYKNLDEMYAAIGFGAITASRIISNLLQEYKREHNEEIIEKKLAELTNNKEKKQKVSDSGVIVKNIDNCLVKLSKCCNPLPGDEIVGYITKGRGVSVHRKDCVNVKELLNEENRMIDVKWYNSDKNTDYNVDIEVHANDRNGLLADLTSEINKTKSKIIGVNAKANKDDIVTIDFTVEIKDLEVLNKIINALRKVDSVYDVRRRKQ